MACPSGALLSQPPSSGDGFWKGSYSDDSANNHMYESFSGLENAICGVYWWGLGDDGSGTACDRNLTTCAIEFYEAGATAGTLVQEYAVTPIQEDTGLDYNGHRLYRYSAQLDPALTLAEGWISIHGTGDTECYFQWMSSDTGDGSCGMWRGDTNEFSVIGPDQSFCLVGSS